MPDHDKPIADCDLWDIIDWNVVAALSAQDTGDPRDSGGQNVLPAMATLLLRAGANSDREAQTVFLKIASGWIRHADDAKTAIRRQDAGRLAAAFGARPDRLIEYLKKFGRF